jgi:hypothetical protein
MMAAGMPTPWLPLMMTADLKLLSCYLVSPNRRIPGQDEEVSGSLVKLVKWLTRLRATHQLKSKNEKLRQASFSFFILHFALIRWLL